MNQAVLSAYTWERTLGGAIGNLATMLQGPSAVWFAILRAHQQFAVNLEAAATDWPTWSPVTDRPMTFFLRTDGVGQGPIEDAPAALVTYLREANCVVLTSAASSPVFKRVVKAFTRRYFPRITPVYWDTQALLGLVRPLAEDEHIRSLRITHMSYRSPIGEGRTGRKYDSRREWTELSLSDASLHLRELNAWLRLVDFACVSEHTAPDSLQRAAPVEGRLSRDSLFSCRLGRARFWDLIVLPACRAAAREQGIFRDRHRGQAYEQEAEAIDICYEAPIFSDREQNAALIEALHKLPDASLSVLHANPYLHATVTDALDGSSFDVWVTEADRITIMPGARATGASLERLCSHVTDGFREGDIREFE